MTSEDETSDPFLPADRSRLEALQALKRSEEALKASEELYMRLFDEAIVGIALADAENGILLDCNQAFLDLVERPREDVIGRPQTMLHPPEHGSLPVSRTFEEFRTGRSSGFLPDKIATGSGAIRDVEIKGSPLEIGGRLYLLGFFRDVTEERRHHYERETTLELLRLLNVPNHVRELIRSVTKFLQEVTGCEAVGVRLKDGEDYPYYETRGFPAEFIEAENCL